MRFGRGIIDIDNREVAIYFYEQDGKKYRMDGDLFGDFSLTENLVEPKRYLPPVSPPNIFALGLNYGGHVKETGIKGKEEPQFFMKATSSIVGEGEDIVLPSEAPDFVDYEAELGIVIAKRCKSVSEDDAAKYILGYVCANDISARDCQFDRDIQWIRAKSFDTFCPVSRYIVSGIDPTNLSIKSILNGRVMQNSRTSNLINNPFQVVSFLSKQMTLLPGTLILTGTPEGVGFKRNPPVYLRAGDTITVEIEGVGKLTNRVKKEED